MDTIYLLALKFTFRYEILASIKSLRRNVNSQIRLET